MYPRYSYAPRVLLGLLRDGLLRRRRDFHADACLCIARLHPPLQVLGLEHVPPRGRYALTLNHYYRPGFASQWSALAISAAVAPGLRWVMTNELTFPGSPIASLGRPLSRFVLARAARVYDFAGMPPMPPRPRDVNARAAAVRDILHYVARTPDARIALAPEGGDQPGGHLSMPPSGAGRFCLLLASAGIRFVPVGVYELDGALHLNFGPPYALRIGAARSAEEKDRLAAYALMSHIAPLLPLGLRGQFAQHPSPQ